MCAYRRQSDVGEARQCVSVKITVRKNVFFVFTIFAGTIFSKRFCREGTRSEEHLSQHSPANSLIISMTNARYRSAVLREALPFNHLVCVASRYLNTNKHSLLLASEILSPFRGKLLQ